MLQCGAVPRNHPYPAILLPFECFDAATWTLSVKVRVSSHMRATDFRYTLCNRKRPVDRDIKPSDRDALRLIPTHTHTHTHNRADRQAWGNSSGLVLPVFIVYSCSCGVCCMLWYFRMAIQRSFEACQRHHTIEVPIRRWSSVKFIIHTKAYHTHEGSCHCTCGGVKMEGAVKYPLPISRYNIHC